ncbi:MAG: SDR family oxidoreductase [Oscillospiraceae bacterium]|nr:SDR family oxidoreductase [Oscillospiraceae bacterium]MCL2279460.1 SDR family oxidoreductase [Oscillospiraceae bacterium]
MLLKGKIALVTGSGHGIGRATAMMFAQNGAVVYANDIDQGSLDDLAGDTFIPLYFDVADTQASKAAIMRIKKEQGCLDCLVNNAGIMQTALIGMADLSAARRMFDINVFAVMDLLQIAARIMMKQKSGSIINFASVVGVSGHAGQLAYSASKGAVIALTKSAAKELAPHNIRVNAVAPGMVDTDLLHTLSDESIKESVTLIGMNRLGKPDDIAKTCLFLASELSDYVTGQIIGVDGSTVM